ncbi:hypothetical protein Lal_00006432 [Lupinus albus]|nr:hypothetical protein Lal_00006432 [Lupinus albus]
MGLQMLDEFEPITPIRTVATSRKTFSHRTELSDLDTTTKDEVKEEKEEECHTPTSPSQILKTPLVCPPPPKKQRITTRSNVIAPSQRFFQLPHDLASVFVLHRKPKIRKNSLLATSYS